MTHPFRIARRMAPAALLLLGACLSSSPPLAMRWFAVPTPWPEQGPDRSDAPFLRMEDVTVAAHLDQRMLWRVSDVEFAFDESNRWIIPPESSVRRALAAELFASGRFRPAPNLDSPTLETWVSAFEAVTGAEPRVEVRLGVVLREQFSGPTRYAAFDASEPLADLSPESYASAMGAALTRAASALADWAAMTTGSGGD